MMQHIFSLPGICNAYLACYLQSWFLMGMKLSEELGNVSLTRLGTKESDPTQKELAFREEDHVLKKKLVTLSVACVGF